jgi:hypothetical protein
MHHADVFFCRLLRQKSAHAAPLNRSFLAQAGLSHVF